VRGSAAAPAPRAAADADRCPPGLGTGSTAAFAVARIGQLMKEGKLKDIVAVPTSIATKNQAECAAQTRTMRARTARRCSRPRPRPRLPHRSAGHPACHAGHRAAAGRRHRRLRRGTLVIARRASCTAPADPLVAQVDPDLNLVKGRGGALLREKVRLSALCTRGQRRAPDPQC
jgi:hypothetical protein